MIRFFYGVNPYELTDDEFCRMQAEINYLASMELIKLEIAKDGN